MAIFQYKMAYDDFQRKILIQNIRENFMKNDCVQSVHENKQAEVEV